LTTGPVGNADGAAISGDHSRTASNPVSGSRTQPRSSWSKAGDLTGNTLNVLQNGTVPKWTVSGLVAEGTGVLTYTVYAGEQAKPLSCNHVVVVPTEGGFTSSRDTHCLWRDLAWWNESYAYRQPLLINAVQQITATGTSAIEIPLGLVFDTETLVDEGKLASDGRDLRVVYWGDAGWEELPREIQGLDSITSTLWFPLQETIEQGLSGDYYLYYGNPWPDSPTQAITQVFGTSSELVAHLNGETTGSEGETGTIGGSGFSWLAEESGFTPASITNTATLTYSHSGAIEPAHGTIALHVKPTWDTDDETTHYLFQAGQAGSDRLEIYKDDDEDDPQVRFKVVAGGESYEVTEDADLVAGGWSSIVATWDDDTHEAHLYQKGEGTNSATITNTVSGTLDLWLGSQAGGGSSAEALMANLFVYDQVLTQAQAESLHRALLWADIMPQDEEWRGATSTMTITYQYDPLYRLTQATYSGGTEYQYTYDAVGNRQTMDSPQGEVSYSYDAANRLTSVDGVTYTWDDNGNLTSDGVRSYSYDHANRLTQVTQGSQTTQFAYNGDGIRTSKTVDGDTTQYVLDLAATLPVVVSDTEAVYLYGLDIIAQQQSERQYYFHDGLGSVRQLLDSTGEVQTNYAYDPFGVPVVTGDASNPYRFTGEAWDAEVELLYLRARYYQPETGRFVTKDPWAGNLWQPGTLNRYVYVTNNPVNLLDPTGLNGADPLGLRGLHGSSDPLTEEQWELARREATLLSVPVELVAGTIAVEIVHDTQWHDPVLDLMLASGLTLHYVGQSRWESGCAVATWVLGGYEHYWGHAGSRGPGPGVTNFHIGTAKMVERYFAQEYPDWRILEAPPDVYARMGLLLSDPVNIHYAAAYLRYLANYRKGTGGRPSKLPHVGDLSDVDMQIIYGGFRAGIGSWKSVDEYQTDSTPGDLGRDIAPFLPFYRDKLSRD
jgi:RHS repeat-associated protein